MKGTFLSLQPLPKNDSKKNTENQKDTFLSVSSG